MTTTEFEAYSIPWVAIALTANGFFFLDLVMHVVLNGVRRLARTRREYILEAVLQCLSVICALVFYFVGIHARIVTCKVLAIIVLFRLLRLIVYLEELEDFKMIMETFRRFSAPFFTVMVSLYTVCFEFAIVGQYLYGGKITTRSVATNEIDAPYLYYLINFNDFYSSMVTLFHVLVINNWNNTTDMYCTVMDSNWPRVYFGLFWVKCVMIMLNIVISYVLEMYSVTSEEIQQRFVKRQRIMKIMKHFESED